MAVVRLTWVARLLACGFGALLSLRGLTADEARREDLATLFPAAGTTVRITRMRADLSHDALADDLVLQASTDQSALSNHYQVTHSVNTHACPPTPVCTCGSGLVRHGCAMSAVESGSTRPDLALEGMLGAMLVGSRVLRRRPRV